MDTFPGKRLIRNAPVQTVIIDACNTGSGFLYNGDWGYVNWDTDYPHLSNSHINVKEILSAVFSVRLSISSEITRLKRSV